MTHITALNIIIPFTIASPELSNLPFMLLLYIIQMAIQIKIENRLVTSFRIENPEKISYTRLIVYKIPKTRNTGLFNTNVSFLTLQNVIIGGIHGSAFLFRALFAAAPEDTAALR